MSLVSVLDSVAHEPTDERRDEGDGVDLPRRLPTV